MCHGGKTAACGTGAGAERLAEEAAAAKDSLAGLETKASKKAVLEPRIEVLGDELLMGQDKWLGGVGLLWPVHLRRSRHRANRPAHRYRNL